MVSKPQHIFISDSHRFICSNDTVKTIPASEMTRLIYRGETDSFKYKICLYDIVITIDLKIA